MKISRWSIVARTGTHMTHPIALIVVIIMEASGLYQEHDMFRGILYVFGLLIAIVGYCFFSHGYVLDVLLKSIKETPVLTAQKVSLGGHIEGLARGKFAGGGLVITDDRGKEINLLIYNSNKALDKNFGVEFKFYYLKRSKVVLDVETIRYHKEVDKSRKPRKSK